MLTKRQLKSRPPEFAFLGSVASFLAREKEKRQCPPPAGLRGSKCRIETDGGQDRQHQKQEQPRWMAGRFQNGRRMRGQSEGKWMFSLWQTKRIRMAPSVEKMRPAG